LDKRVKQYVKLFKGKRLQRVVARAAAQPARACGSVLCNAVRRNVVLCSIVLCGVDCAAGGWAGLCDGWLRPASSGRRHGLDACICACRPWLRLVLVGAGCAMPLLECLRLSVFACVCAFACMRFRVRLDCMRLRVCVSCVRAQMAAGPPAAGRVCATKHEQPTRLVTLTKESNRRASICVANARAQQT